MSNFHLVIFVFFKIQLLKTSVKILLNIDNGKLIINWNINTFCSNILINQQYSNMSNLHAYVYVEYDTLL